MKRLFAALALVSFAACSAETDTPSNDASTNPDEARLLDELGVGEANEPGEFKADGFAHNGEEDYSEFCKEIPELEPLNDPEILISVDGLTLRLRDRQGEYDKVFNIGVGKIGEDGESLTPTSADMPDGLFHIRADYTAITDAPDSENRKWAWNYACRIWSGTKYFNPRTNEQEYRSYFAGLPFLRFEGPAPAVYGIHGPIDNYWRDNGGELYSGYVSGGCIRMDADDLVEVYARIRGNKTPTKVQREPEMGEDGLPIDPDRFVGAYCNSDDDCTDGESVCVDHPTRDTRFCTAPCETTRDCPIRENDIVGSIGIWSYCVADQHDLVEGDGYCVVEGNNKTNNSCKRYRGDLTRQRLASMDDPTRSFNVCAP